MKSKHKYQNYETDNSNLFKWNLSLEFILLNKVA